MSDRTLAVIQARMTSTRLPGKVLREVAGRPLLAYQLERLRQARSIDRIVLATTTNDTDEPLVAFARSQHLAVVRGPEDDVLERFSQVVRLFQPATVVRLTADCPLLPAELVDEAVDRFYAQGCDYLSNMIEPRYPYGLAVEVVRADVLLQAAAQAADPQEREHVTPFIYWRPERFRIGSMKLEEDLSRHRWTVDTLQDFELVSRILSALYAANPQFSMADVLALLSRHPDWPTINATVQQKAVQPRGVVQQDPP